MIGEDLATLDRRRALLGAVMAAIGAIEVDATDGKLDLASVLLSAGLTIASDEIGLLGVAGHLQNLAAQWAAKAAREQSARGAVH